MRNNMLRTMAASSSLCITLTMATMALADDTELYSAAYQSGATGKPKVLVIFDNSGSMSTVVQGVKPDYDPNATYVTAVPADRIYWSTNGNVPDLSSNTQKKQWFPSSANSCASSLSSLSQSGYATATAQRWQPGTGNWDRQCERSRGGSCTRWGPWEWDGDVSGWLDLSGSVNAPPTVDCRQDVTATPPNSTNASGIGAGYPKKPANLVYPNTPDANPYQTAISNNAAATWNKSYTFYTSHYVNWANDTTITPPDTTFLRMAKDVIKSIVQANGADLDFGLAKFNRNSDDGNSNGGLIVQRIIEDMTAANITTLSNTIENISSSGNTPLCETLWESFLYMKGRDFKWGGAGDALARSGTKYISPLEACTNTYIIYMTDGEPTEDTAADGNSYVGSLTAAQARKYGCDNSGNNCDFSSKLALLSEYMATHDLDGDNGNGEQNVKIATIGLNVPGGAGELLLDAATLDYTDENNVTKPAYFFANSAEALRSAFQSITLGILTKESTFTSPAVAVDSFSRTESRDAVFYAMFEPKTTVNWSGNIKKLKLKTVNGQAVIVDRNNNPAFDGVGGILDSAETFWGTGADGPTVAQGGVGELLRARTLSTRKILTNTGTNGALEAFSAANVDAAAYGLDTDAELFATWQAADAADLAKTIDWGWGYDVDDVDNDDSTTDTRGWIMADILHSKPLAINYGALGSFTKDNPDMRIVAGTNNGILHMFGNDDGQEDWAFFAKELGSALTKRRKNSSSTKNVYGIDAPTTTYTLDVNQDGTLDAAAGDKVYLYFGLRGGGNLLYAMDISDPDAPSFMWMISNEDADFGELGQTWSVPRVTHIPGYKHNSGVSKPVLIFGAGYDTVNDDHDTFAGTVADTMGRGIFIVDAVTGAKVWSVTPADNSATNMKATGLVHSVAADVTPVDSNGDGIFDRIYFADTGGNVWRVDMPGNTLPTNAQDTWFVSKLFEANGNTATTDRRFFSAPDVVKTRFAGKSIDAVLIGSGDRTNPIAKDNPDDVNDRTVDEQFYMIRDERTIPYTEDVDMSKCADEDYNDFRCDMPIDSDEDLYDVTDNPLYSGSEEDKKEAAADLAAAHGWRMDLKGNGEKSLSSSVTISGKVLFTTFSPEGDLVQCGFSRGTGRLYAVDLFTGGAAVDFNNDGTIDQTDGGEERFAIIGSLIPETPTIVVTRDPICDQDCQDNDEEGAPGGGDGKIWTLLPGYMGDPDAELSGPYGNFWYREDY